MATEKPMDLSALRSKRDAAAQRGDHGEALSLNDKIVGLKDMTIEEIDEQTQGSDLYGPTVKHVMRKFSDALAKRRLGQ